MKTTDDEKRRLFRTLHDPKRPIFQIAHAKRTNSAEEYSSVKIREAGKRLLEGNMKVAHGVMQQFELHAKKPE